MEGERKGGGKEGRGQRREGGRKGGKKGGRKVKNSEALFFYIFSSICPYNQPIILSNVFF